MATGANDLEVDLISVSLRRQVEERLRRAIVRGRFAPGQHLSDRALCELFKVSRTLVREAMRQLEAEGLVESFPHRGSFVRVLTAAEAVQIYDVRAALEPLAARKFVRHATEEQVKELVLSFEDIKSAVARNDTDEMVDKKQAFYNVLFSVPENTYIRTMLNQILNWSGQLRATSMSVPDRLPSTVVELERLITAIKRRDEEEAASASLQHVQNAAATALGVLDDRGAERRTG